MRDERFAHTRLQVPWNLLSSAVPRRSGINVQLEGARIVHVHAPAGFGKTVWVLQRFQEAEIAPAWISIAPPLHTGRLFWPALLESLLPQIAGDTEALSVRFSTITEHPESAIIALCNALPGGDHRIDIVLDDFHNADEDIVASLSLFADNAPSGVRLWIVSRRDEARHFAQFALHGQLTSIGTEELRFSVDECAAVVCGIQPNIPPERISSIMVRTQGWPAGVCLLSRVIRDGGDTDVALDPSQDTTETLGPVILEEILKTLTNDVAEVVLRASILPIIDADAIDFVCTGVDLSLAIATLRALCRDGFFLTRTPGESEMYEFQPFFRDLLQTYRITHGIEYAGYTERAIQHLEDRGLIDHAIVIARQAGRYDLLASTLARRATHWFMNGRYGEFLAMCREIPGGEKRRHDPLTAQIVWARTVLQKDCTDEELTPDPDASPATKALLAAARGYSEFHNEGNFSRCVAALSEARDLFELGYPSAGTIRNLVELEAHNRHGDPETASDMLVRTNRDELYEVSPYLGVLHDINRGMVLEQLARFLEARALYEDSRRRIIDRYGTGEFPFFGFLEIHRLFLESHETEDPTRRHAVSEALLRVEEHGIEEMVSLAHMMAAPIVAPEDVQVAYDHIDRSLATIGRSRWGRRLVLANAVAIATFYDTPAEAQRWLFQMHSISATGDLGFAAPILAEAWVHVHTGDTQRAETVLAGLRSYPHLSPLHDLEARLLRTRITTEPGSTDRREIIDDFTERGLGLWARSTLGTGTGMAAPTGTSIAPGAPAVAGATGLLGVRTASTAPAAPGTPGLRDAISQLTDEEIRALRDTQHTVTVNGFKEAFQGRELQILYLMARGASNAEIGATIYVSVNTVRWYARQIFAKLDVRRRGEAVQTARLLGLLDGAAV